MVRIADTITGLKFRQVLNFKEICKDPLSWSMPLRLLGIISVALLLLIYSSRALVLSDGSGQDYMAVVFALRHSDLLLNFGDGSRFQAKICALIVKLENIEVAICSKAKGYFRSISSGRQVSDKLDNITPDFFSFSFLQVLTSMWKFLVMR